MSRGPWRPETKKRRALLPEWRPLDRVNQVRRATRKAPEPPTDVPWSNAVAAVAEHLREVEGYAPEVAFDAAIAVCRGIPFKFAICRDPLAVRSSPGARRISYERG